MAPGSWISYSLGWLDEGGDSDMPYLQKMRACLGRAAQVCVIGNSLTILEASSTLIRVVSVVIISRASEEWPLILDRAASP